MRARGGSIRHATKAVAKRILSCAKSEGTAKKQSAPSPGEAAAAVALSHRSPAGSSLSAASTTEDESNPRSSSSSTQEAEEESICVPSLVGEFEIKEDLVLGRGAFGVVSLGVHKLTGMERAIKTIELRNSYADGLIKNEVDIMRELDHPNIVRYIMAFPETERVHIAMELCRGGQLFARVVEAGTFCEREAAIVMQQALSAVHYLHCRDIVHRDLKADNFIFLSEAPIESNTLKLIDFGLATRLEPGEFLEARIGTGEYMAPQVWRGKYDKQCDVWSSGVIAYTLLSGRFPFRGKGRKELRESILAGRWDFRHPCWEQISEDAKDLIRGLLRASPKSRLTAKGALSHEWVGLRTRSTTHIRCLDQSLVESMKVTQSQAILKRAILRLIVGWVDVDDVFLDVRSQFQALDKNKDGVLTRAEIRDGLTTLSLTEEEIEGALEDIMSGRNQIEYTEFLSAALHQGSFLTGDVIMKAFRCLDTDGDGVITLQDLECCKRKAKPRWLGISQALKEASIADLLRDANVEDLQLNFAQFERWLGTCDA